MDLARQDLRRHALHAAYAAGLSPRALLAETFRRIETAGDPGIFLDLTPPAAIDAAIEALPAFDPEKFPLWGLPCAVKDNIDVAGRPTTAACPAFAHVAGTSARVVRQLQAAGAIVVGKTNLDQFATGLVGVRTPYPPPRNAIAPDRVPGGSSSGSAVAVARALVTFALGTDTAGSGRVPAALNGIVGLKPSLGMISNHGVVPACRSLDTVSVFATEVADAWAVFAAITGEDGGGAPPVHRIAVPDDAACGLLEPEARVAWHALLRGLPQLGLCAEPVDLAPFIAAGRMLYEDAFVAERAASFGHLVPREDMHHVTRTILESAENFSATDAFRAIHRLAALRTEACAVFANADALLVPSVPCFPTLAEVAADPFGPNARLGIFTNFVNLFDLAAIAVPSPARPDGLPAGVTLIGPRGSDARLAASAARLHAAAAVTEQVAA